MLDASNISVRFGGVLAIDSVSIRVNDHEVVGLVGPNGSGKSTFINAITGLVRATGSLTVDGRHVSLGKLGASSGIGVRRTFQTPQVDDELTCLENVLVGLADQRLRGLDGSWLRRIAMMKREHARWAKAIEALDFVGVSVDPDTLGGALSYGERRRVELARAYAGSPKLLLLDEPAAGLNQSETDELVELLVNWRSADGPALLVVEHKIDFLQQLCQRMVVLQLGKVIAEGKPADVWRIPAVIDAYLGTVTADA